MTSELQPERDPEGEEDPKRIARRYQVRRLLGRGGFGAVYEAFDELEDRVVALKLIRRDSALGARLGPPDSSHAQQDSRIQARRTVTRSFGAHGSHGDTAAAAFKEEYRVLTQLHHPNLATVHDFGRCADTESVIDDPCIVSVFSKQALCPFQDIQSIEPTVVPDATASILPTPFDE